jgi:hypothetical protein
MCKGLFALMMIAAPRVALACPICFGQSDAPMAQATNLGILAMLGVVVGMLASFGAFFVYLNRRARLAAASDKTEKGLGTAQC